MWNQSFKWDKPTSPGMDIFSDFDLYDIVLNAIVGKLLLVDLAKIQYTRNGEGPDLCIYVD